MDNKQIAHLWANKSRESAKGSNFYFEGDTIYSYGSHFPIARHYKGVILFTSKDYSVSTSKHKSYVRSACSHLTLYTVADVKADPGRADVLDYAKRINDASMAAARARDPQWKLKWLEELIGEANNFCARFGFKTRFSAPENMDALRAKAKEQTAKTKKANELRRAKAERDLQDRVKRWLAGEIVSIHDAGKVFLRAIYKASGGINGVEDWCMQTSKGAIVPLSEASKAFRFVMLKREKGWHRNGDQFPIGEFHLDAVNEQGVVAGCHRITWDEIERFAKTQNWI